MSESPDRADYPANRTAERLLNAAIVRADIAHNFEEYLDIFDRFYAAEIEARCEGQARSVKGKGEVRSRLERFLIPLHVLVVGGGLAVSVRAQPIPSDGSGETHSSWTLEITGGTGRRSVLSWRTQRRWHEGKVVFERQCDVEQTGGPLTIEDLLLAVKPGGARPEETIQ